uniref:HYPK_UBA domain-containing protein n=1 Tax=Caenorhabditis tropicalis TaxID=1561998 RepID=A0A1I7ULY6_9PELO
MAEEDDKQQVDKHNWGSEELSKVSDTREDKDDLKLNTDALGNLFNSSAPAPTRPKINIKKEDLQLIMNELELPESTVRAKLLETNGDVREALRSLCGL